MDSIFPEKINVKGILGYVGIFRQRVYKKKKFGEQFKYIDFSITKLF